MPFQHPSSTTASGAAFLTSDLRVAHVDEAFARSSGRPCAAHHGCTLDEVLPELAPLIAPLLRQALATNAPVVDAAMPVSAPDQPPCLVSCYPVRARAGGLLGLDLVLRVQPADAAAPARAGVEQLGYDALHTIAGHVPAGIALFDGKDVRLRWANEYFLNLLDESQRSTSLGNKLEDFAPQTVANGIINIFRAVAATRQPYSNPEYQSYDSLHGTTYWQTALLPLDAPGHALPDLLLLLTDITDATSARYAAEALTAQLTAVLQQLPAGVIIAEAPSAQIIAGNGVAERLLRAPIHSGAPLDASSAVWQLLHADGSPYAAHELPLARALRHGETVQGDEAHIAHADGTLATLLVNAAPVQNSAGAVTSAVMTLLDISSRVVAEQALRASEERLRLALSAGQMGTWELDLHKEVIQCSESTDMLFGLAHTGGPSPHHNYLNRVHPDDRALVTDSIAHAVADGIEHIIEYRVLLPNHQTRWLISRGTLVHNPDAPAPTLRGAVIDITQRRQAEQQQKFLIEASKLLGSSFDYAATLTQVMQLGVRSFADLCIVELRAADGALEILDIIHDDLVDGTLTSQLRQHYLANAHKRSGASEAFHGGHALLFATVDDALLVQAACSEEELALLRAIGPRSMMMLPLIVREQIVGSMTIALSTTTYTYTHVDLEMAEDLARRASTAIENARLFREVRQAVQVRDVFLSIAAHELKTPLTALIGQAQLLQRRIARADSTPERDTRTITTIIEQARRIDGMITALLDVSRLERGQLTIMRAPLDVAALVQHVATTLETSPRHTISYTGPDAPLIISGDKLRLEQVLHNLVNNAIKYSPDGGAVALHVQQYAQHVSCAVTDHGIGIPEAARDAIFEQFFRVESGATEHIVGFGIGLYVVKQIVAQHGGEISVSSVEGQGSTFTIVLPLGGG